jgi:hypothetical protein
MNATYCSVAVSQIYAHNHKSFASALAFFLLRTRIVRERPFHVLLSVAIADVSPAKTPDWTQTYNTDLLYMKCSDVL